MDVIREMISALRDASATGTVAVNKLVDVLEALADKAGVPREEEPPAPEEVVEEGGSSDEPAAAEEGEHSQE